MAATARSQDPRAGWLWLAAVSMLRHEHRELIAELGIVPHHDVEEEAAHAHHQQRPPAALHLPHRAAAVVEPDGRGEAVDE